MSNNTANKKSTDNPLLARRKETLQNRRPYALEPAGHFGDIPVINDSASTTLEKSGQALMSLEGPLVWIVDSTAYLQDFSLLAELIRSRVKVIIATGDYVDDLHRAIWNDIGYFIAAGTWDEAMEMATLVSRIGDTILFSPGCRATEPFENYSERGAYFNQLVKIKSQ